MSRSEMKKYLIVILSFTLLLVPELFHALPDGAAAARIAAEDEQDEEALLKFDLMHVDHPDSPLYVRDRTVTERFKASLTRSRNWESLRKNRKPSIAAKAGVKPSLTFASPVSYSQAGIFLIPIALGTPQQTFTVILDTGSDITWVQCSPCAACYEQSTPLFDPTKSRTYSIFTCDSEPCSQLRDPQCDDTRCQYSVKYGDQSTTTGDLSGDAITLTSISGRTKGLDFHFGCGHNNQGTFQSTDGIVGFGRGSLSLPSQLGSTFGNIFSYCLDAAEKSSPLLLGKGLARTEFSWTPLVKNEAFPSFYFMNVTGISVNGALLEIPPSAFTFDSQGEGGFIIDSGTTVTLLVPAAFNPLLDGMRATVPYPEVSGEIFGVDLCYSTANFTNPEFPGAVLHMGNGAELSLPARNLWVAVDSFGTVCFALLSSSFGFNIFGNIQQQDIHIAFDLHHNRLGFQTNVDCSSL